MRYLAPTLAVLLLTPAAMAQRNIDLTGSYVWMDPTGGGAFEDLADPADIEIEADAGFGVSANFFFSNRVSAEFAVAQVESESDVRRRAVGAGGPGGNLKMMPVTAVLQYHFAPDSFIDPYIGGGAAYVLYDFSESTGVHGIDEIDFDDDIGFAVNAGVGIRLGNRFGLTIDGKYVPLESNARAVIISADEESEGRIDVSPIIISAGVTLRF